MKSLALIKHRERKDAIAQQQGYSDIETALKAMNGKITTKEISVIFETTPQNVGHWLNKLGIQQRYKNSKSKPLKRKPHRCTNTDKRETNRRCRSYTTNRFLCNECISENSDGYDNRCII